MIPFAAFWGSWYRRCASGVGIVGRAVNKLILLLLGGDITWDPWIVDYVTFASWQETNTTGKKEQ